MNVTFSRLTPQVVIESIMPLDLYVMPASPPCRAVLMLVRELDIDVNVKNIDLLKGEQNSQEFLTVSTVESSVN